MDCVIGESPHQTFYRNFSLDGSRRRCQQEQKPRSYLCSRESDYLVDVITV